MAKVSCPGCEKSYTVPDGTTGSATCKACGTRFRISKRAAKKVTAPTPDPTPVDDNFSWDEALDEEFQVEAPAETEPPSNPIVEEALARAAADIEPDEKKVRWGFQWERVAGGALMFLGAAAALLVLPPMRRITMMLVAAAIVGFFTMLSGLMGEEGIW